MTTTLIGAAPGKVTNYPEFELGQVANIEAAEYIYIKAAQTFISSHSAILIDFNNTGHLLTADNALLNSRIGVAGETPLKGQYLWVQVRGDSYVLVAAGVTARSGLYPGDNPGVLTNTSGDNYVSGMATVVGNGLAVAAVRCRLNNPRIELTPGTSTSTGGISASRARALIADWAETSNTDQIPTDKLGNAPAGGLNQNAVDARVTAGVSDWAETGNTDAIPANKLTNAPAGSGNGNGNSGGTPTQIPTTTETATVLTGVTVEQTETVLYESTADETFNNTTWNNFDVSRALTAADDSGTICVQLFNADTTPEDRARNSHEFPAARFRTSTASVHTTSDDGAEIWVGSMPGGYNTVIGNLNRTVGIRKQSATQWSFGGRSATSVLRIRIVLYVPTTTETTADITYLTSVGSADAGATLTKTAIANMGDWEILWQAGTAETSRLTTAGNTNRNLISGREFSDYDVLIAWIDNGGNREGKFMYVRREQFTDVFSTTDTGSGWVDWSDSGWIGMHYHDDTTFRKTGGGMGLRKLYGAKSVDVVTDVDVSVTGLVDGGNASELTAKKGVQTYTASDVKKLVNEDGVAKIVVPDPHPGHGKLVGRVKLTDTRFLGLRDNLPSSAVHSQFIYSTTGGQFLMHLTNGSNGFTGVSGAYVYDPFGLNPGLTGLNLAATIADGVWQTAPAGNNYTGALDWNGFGNNFTDFDNAAEAVGQVFAVRFQGIYFVDTFTPETDGYKAYRSRLLVPHYFNNPILVHYGQAQTAAITAHQASNSVADANNHLLRWNTTPDEKWFGAEDDFITFLTRAQVTGEDLRRSR